MVDNELFFFYSATVLGKLAADVLRVGLDLSDKCVFDAETRCRDVVFGLEARLLLTRLYMCRSPTRRRYLVLGSKV